MMKHFRNSRVRAIPACLARSASMLAVVALIIACSGRVQGVDPILFETYTVDKTVSITSEAGAPSCSVSLQIAVPTEEGTERSQAIGRVLSERLFSIDMLSVREAADSFASNYTRSYVEDFGPLYREDRGDEQKRSWYEYHYTVSSETASGRGGVTVYTAVVDYYEGGAHGMNLLFAMNFDNATGQLLQLSDFFTPGYEGALKEKLLKALMLQTGSKDLAELRDKGYLYLMDMFVPDNFMLGADGVTFIYNPYDIAPYSMGRIELVLSYGDLKDILKPAS